MYENFIKPYIDKLNKEDIIKFAKNNDVSLENYELDIIYNYIKNDWKTLIFGNPTSIFDDLKLKLKEKNYNKCVVLYNKYKSKIF